MENLFIPYKLAVIAKEKGFDEQCFGYFRKGELQFFDKRNIVGSNQDLYKSDYIKAPMYQQLVDWFREKHNLYLSPIISSLDKTEKRYFISIMQINNNDVSRQLCFDQATYTYYEAINKAIENAFKLI